MTLHWSLNENADTFPDRPMIHYENRTWTYAEVDDLTDRIGAALLHQGVQTGDRVALLFTNCPELVFSCYACFKIGAVAVPINTRFQAPELLYVLNHSEASFLIGQSDLCTPILSRREDLPHLSGVAIAGAERSASGMLSFDELCRLQAARPQFPSIADEHLAVVFYTSGTTARPKGVMHTHGTLLRLIDNMISVAGTECMARTVIALPLCHMGAFGCQLLPSIHIGSTLWLLPRFEPDAVLRALTESRATYWGGLPVHFNMLNNVTGAERYDLSALRYCIAGGDTLPLEVHSRFKSLFGVHIDELCGMTEIIYCSNRPPDIRRIGSIGKPIGDVCLGIVDNEGQEVPQGEEGEIVVYSDAVTPGYWNDHEATATALRNGGMYTGDLARQDEEGYYWFVGRKKDIIIRGGSNIAPAEVEEVLYAHPAVYEAGVVGVPDPFWGQIVRAYVALKPGAQATESELIRFLQEHLAAYKVPARILFLNELPKNPTGKIFRKTLRELAMEGEKE